jgi:putative membrane protein
MLLISKILILLVAALHLYIMVLQMFLWTRKPGLRAFSNTPDKAQLTRVFAANQGLYNGFLAAGLAWGAVSATRDVATFFLLCVIIAGIYGGYSVSRRIVLVQALPAALALVLLWLGL